MGYDTLTILILTKELTHSVESTNVVDIIYSAWPALLYTNPAIGRYLLEPVLAYQAANPVQGGYAIGDIGELVCIYRYHLLVYS